MLKSQYSGKSIQYHVCWCSGSLHHQDKSTIDYFHYFQWANNVFFLAADPFILCLVAIGLTGRLGAFLSLLYYFILQSTCLQTTNENDADIHRINVSKHIGLRLNSIDNSSFAIFNTNFVPQETYPGSDCLKSIDTLCDSHVLQRCYYDCA